MPEAKDAIAKSAGAPPKKGKGKLPLIIGAALVLLLGGGAGAYFLLPAVSGPVNAMLGIGGAEDSHGAGHGAHAAGPATTAEVPRPAFVEMPELSITLPNGGRPRQLRLTLALEVIGDANALRPTINNPRVYDSLLLYLRTLKDGELEGALALDRLRGDLFRRLDLLLGANIIRDVLITSFVMA